MWSIRGPLSALTGSLWDPSITACRKDEKTVEVNFTTCNSTHGSKYRVLIQQDTVIGSSTVTEVLTLSGLKSCPQSPLGRYTGSFQGA